MFKNIKKKSGFDDIDLIVEIEQTFNIQITDENASKVFIVGELFDLIISKLPHRQSNNSFQLISFYEFRKKLNDYNLSVRINDLDNLPFSKIFYFENKDFLLNDFPFLSYSLIRGLTTFWTIFFIFTLSFALILLYFLLNIQILLIIGILCFVIFSLTLYITREYKFIHPHYNLKEMFLDYFEFHYSNYIEKYKIWNKSEVWFIVRRIISRYVLVNIDKIYASSRFIEDLELDVDG